MTISTFIALLFSACTPNVSDTESAVTRFYEVYNEREDFEAFLDFYDEKIVFEDIISGDKIVDKEALRKFFDWNNPGFKKLETNALEIEEKIIYKNKAVIKGSFRKFGWGDAEFEAMHFTTILIFGKSGKIIKQTDWINYPTNLLDYEKRKNSNDWLD